MYDIEELNDIATLAQRRSEWQALVDQTAEVTFFHTFDWLEVFWKHYGAERKLRTIFVSQGGELVGILPLVVQTEQRKVGPVRVLTYPLNDWGSFYGPLGARPTETLEAGLRHVFQTRRDWDLGHEIALCGRLIKGYGTTNERGKENLRHVLDHLSLGPSPQQCSQAIAAARQAALADDAGTALDAALVQHGAPPRPIKEQPIRFVRRAAAEGKS